MATPKHIFRVKNMVTGATAKRVGMDDYYAAKRLADSWAATLTLQTGQGHKAEKVRNAYGSGKGRTVPKARLEPAAARFAALLAEARAACAATGARAERTLGPVRIVVYTVASVQVMVHGKRCTHPAAIAALGGKPVRTY